MMLRHIAAGAIDSLKAQVTSAIGQMTCMYGYTNIPTDGKHKSQQHHAVDKAILTCNHEFDNNSISICVTCVLVL